MLKLSVQKADAIFCELGRINYEKAFMLGECKEVKWMIVIIDVNRWQVFSKKFYKLGSVKVIVAKWLSRIGLT